MPPLPTIVDLASIRPEDAASLRRAVLALERVSFASRLASLAGRQVELASRALPESAAKLITSATQAALRAAMTAALLTIRKKQEGRAANGLHKALAAASGAAGGAFGLATLPVELPISTTIMLRSIAAIARAEGADLSRPETALSLMQVFALGGRRARADSAKGGYFAVRAVLAHSVSEAVRFLAERSVVDEAAPVLVRLMALIAGRFGAVVSQKVALQAIPVFGALGGAAVNLAFIDHFQEIARGHFIVRRLERIYGEGPVRVAYEQIRHAM